MGNERLGNTAVHAGRDGMKHHKQHPPAAAAAAEAAFFI
jgi:hypothetical protein